MAIFALFVDAGFFRGNSLSAVKIGWAGHAGKAINLYIDASAAQRGAATALATALFGDFGEIRAVRHLPISLEGVRGKYTLAFDNGAIGKMTTEPILGADNTTPIRIVNGLTPWLPTISQGRTVQARLVDDAVVVDLSNTNAFFDDQLHYSGDL